MKRYLISTIKTFTCCMIIILSSCSDDLLYNSDYIGEGEGTISFNMRFEPIVPALEETRTAGNVIKNIENVSVVVFNKNKTLFKIFRSNNDELEDYRVTYENNSLAPDRPGTTETTEQGTAIANFKLTNIPFGEYYFYVVANVNLDENSIDSPDDLKGIEVPWELDWKPSTTTSDKYLSNKAMFGYFRDAESEPTLEFNAPLIVINKGQNNLYAWIRRLASKVTIAFDPSGLNESVHIYIKSVTIHDIPKSCYLGKNNEPKSKELLYEKGETINYYSEGNENNIDGWLHLMKGSGIKGSNNHNDTDNALFFFENMQGDYEGQRDYYKPQIQGETNESISNPVKDENGNITNDFKDRVEFGSYIEVKAYYDSQNTDNLSSGPITYRFMLGQNTTFNYNAIRNHHYKLTLKFNGWANEPDWHIVYEEPTPTIFLPTQYYISYLYNQSMELPVRIVGLSKSQRDNYYLHSEIIENNWIPYDPATHSAPLSQMGSLTDINGFVWDENSYKTIYTKDGKPVNYVGFLSVRKNDNPIVGNTMSYGENANIALEKYYNGEEANFGGTNILHVNPRDKAYYYLDMESDNIDITPQPGTITNEDDGVYRVKYLGDPSEGESNDTRDVMVYVPFYTRAKELVSASDFTANNPFYAYQRKAKVRFTLREKATDKIVPFKEQKVEDEEPKDASYKDIPIYQVRRIVNPKGIWRAHDNDDEFKVELMHLEDGGSTKFEEFVSEGKWRVSVDVDQNDFILINGRKLNQGEYIEGTSGTHISFIYKPKGTIAKNETRCGIIKVEYHDYTCTHLIFVRQGYDAPVELGVDKIVNGGYYSRKAKWSCYNVVAAQGDQSGYTPNFDTGTNNFNNTRTVYVTKSPLSIGSFFKRCQYNYAILESNNDSYKWLEGIGPLKTAYIDDSGAYKERDNISWSSIGGLSWATSTGTSRFDKSWASNWNAINLDNDINNKELQFPTIEHYRGLREGCEYGYGIVYGDGATEVAKDITDASGFTDYKNNNNADDKDINKKGMRACIIYNPENGDQIIFPLGAQGQGRRVRAILTGSLISGAGSGSLTYSGINGLLPSSQYRPLTYNIYRNPGAIYWFRQPGTKDYAPEGEFPEIAAWDINYYTLVFNPYSHASLSDRYPDGSDRSNSSDAYPIRLIYR